MDYSGLLSQIAPTTIQQAQGQQLQQQLQANQAQNQAIQAQSAQQELASKKRGMSLSILNGLSTLDPSKAQDLYPTFKGMAERIDPTMQLPDDYDPTMLKALMPSQIPITSMPEYQMNTAKGAFYRTLADQAAGGQGQPAPGMSAGSPATGGIMPPTGVPSQGVTSAPTGTSLLSQPSIAQGLAIFDPAGSQALTAQQKLQYESPEGKQAGAEGQKTGENAADAGKLLTVMTSNLPRAMQRFGEMQDAAKDASYGPEWWVNNEGSGAGQQYHNTHDDPTGAANTVLQQAEAQGILPELSGQLQGMRPNKFLESIASSASGLNLSAGPQSKSLAIQGLQNQYIANLKAAAAQVRAYGGQAPTDAQIDAAVANQQAQAKLNSGKKTPTHATTTPGASTQAVNPATALQHARDAIKAGAPVPAVVARLRQMGVDTSGL